MPTRGGKVHVATTRRHYKGTEYTTTLLRRSYREDGKVKNETLGNLSHLPDHVIVGLRAMLAGRRLVDLDSDFEIVRSDDEADGEGAVPDPSVRPGNPVRLAR